MAPSFTDLITIPSVQDIFDGELAPILRSNKVRVTDWLVGGAYRALGFFGSSAWQQGRTALATLTASTFGDMVFGFVDAPLGIDLSSWVTPYAKGVYGVRRIEATFTIRTITLTNATLNTYGPISDGSCTIVCTTTGNRYKNVGALTIAASTTTTASFRSEYAVNSAIGRSYIDTVNDGHWQIVTAQYPGVTVSNPCPTGAFSPVSSTGAGTGTIAPTGSPGAAHSLAVRVDAAGVIGGGSWSVSLDGGAFVSQGAIGTLANFGGTGITITPTNGAGTPSFPAGALFYFNAPGSDVTQAGRDQETPGATGTRCYALYPSLAFPKDAGGNWIPASPTLPAYEAMALSASDQVKVAFAKTDPTINGKVNIVIAAQGGVLPSSVVALVQLFFNAFHMLTNNVAVSSPTPNVITLGGATIKYRGTLATVQAALTARLSAYLAGVDPLSPLPVNGLLDRSYINSLIRSTPGVTHLDDALTINTVAADLQLPTSGTYGLATWDGASGNPVSSAFTWTPAT